MKKKLFLIIIISLFIIATIILTILFWPLIRDLKDPEYRERFSLWVKSLGIKGWFILFGIQVLQIVVAIIPGGPVELIAGAAYGALGGLGICIAGSVFASSLIFFTVKKFGLPLVRRFFGEDHIRTWSFFRDSDKTLRLVFILFLIPGTPKDLLSWLGPLSNLSMPQFIIISNFARIPAILSTAIMGDSMIRGNWVLFLLIFLLTALTGFLGIRFRKKIMKTLARE